MAGDGVDQDEGDVEEGEGVHIDRIELDCQSE